jgi:hypothetical protein
MNEKDKPIECNNHVWYPFLDHELKTTNLAPMQYHRICGICGKIELRDKLKEWRQHYE